MHEIPQEKGKNQFQHFMNNIPIRGVFCLSVIQILMLLPFYLPEAKPTLYFKYKSIWQIELYLPVISILLGHSFLSYAILAGIVFITSKRWVIIGEIMLYLQCLLMLVSVYYYIYFGGYPKIQVIYDFIGSPATGFGYGMTVIGLNDTLIISLICLISFVLIKYALQPLRRCRNCTDIFVFSTIIGVSLISTGLYLTNMPKSRNIFGVAQYHTLPAYMWWGSLISSSSGNSVDLVKKYIPIKNQTKFNFPINAPDHIILIVAESIRADHLPFYGYERNTMPRLSMNSDEWIVFENFYSSEPLTSAALASALGSRYLAISYDQYATKTNSLLFWKLLSQNLYQTSIFSSGSLKWGNMFELISADRVNYILSYNTASEEEKHLFSLPDRIDYHLNDWVILKHYENICRKVTSNRKRTISVFYTVNTHFPYYSIQEDRKFYPTLQEENHSSNTCSAPHSFSRCIEARERCINTYDNSIVTFDRFLNELLMMLKEHNMLERSLLIVTADHGECFGEHDNFFHGSNLFNETVHIPLLIRVGRGLPEIRTRLEHNREEVYSTVDFAPTILESVGIEQPDTFKGTSMLSLTPKPYDILVITTLGKKVAVISKKRKYIYDTETKEALTFDLLADPKEVKNLWINNASNLSSFLKTLEMRQIISRSTQ